MLIKDFSAIRISGRCFPDNTLLNLFQGDKHRLSFVMGRNGSGKSTIASAIRMKEKGELPSGLSAFCLTDEDGTALSDEVDVLNATHVFDEEFIASKVQVKSKGIDAIVMLGDAGDLAEKIESLSNEYNALQKEIASKESALSAYTNHENPLSPQYHRNQARSLLISVGGWGEREKAIRSLHRAASVTDSVISDISKAPFPKQSAQELKASINQGIDKLQQLSESPSYQAAPNIDGSVLAFEETALINLLAQDLQKPELTSREQRLLEIAELFGTTRLEEASTFFSEESHEYCPFCFRDMSDKESAKLVESVRVVLHEEAKAYKAGLESWIIPQLTLDLSQYSELAQDVTENANRITASINDAFDALREAVEKRKENLYTSQKVEYRGIAEKTAELSNKLAFLNELIDDWGEARKQRGDLRESLREQNKQLARIEIDSSLQQAIKQEAAEQALRVDIQNLENKSHELFTNISDLESQKRNIKVALDEINKGLSFIFLDNTRLVLSGDGGEYQLHSHGSSVRPNDVSTGERNAIALCYFFTQIGAGKSLASAYSNEMLLVIDDPISSFDHENRIGMLSYLRWQFKRVLTSNPYNKILCFTHDGYTMNVFEKMCRELSSSCKLAGSSFAIKRPDLLCLADGKLSEWKLTNMRYKSLVNSMYGYALAPDEATRPVIGNIARKALEAFAMFEFGMGLSEFADSDKALSRIGSRATRMYFENLLFHLVLHSESHTGDPVQIECIVETEPEYSPETVNRIIRDSICLMYSINSEHVLNHIDEDESAKETIEGWLHEIEGLLNKEPSKS